MTSGILAFDELLVMAQNPERLEAYRQKEVRLVIDQAPDSMRRRLQGLQFQIDAHRSLHSESPIGACVQLSKMMHDSFSKLQNYLTQAAREAANLQLNAATKPQQGAKTLSADIIHLPLKRS